MKRTLLVLSSIMGSLFVANAQDLITTKQGDDIEAKILEVSPKEMKYKKYSNLEGPTFTMNRSDIVMVRYENGEKEFFGGNNTQLNALGEIHEGMRYREYKELYNHRLYFRDPRDPYSPGWAGVASFFIPGLGQGLSGEWGRALGVFAGDLAFPVLFAGAASVGTAQYEAGTGGDAAYSVAIAAVLGALVYDVWSIVDAVKVAKIKNMYYQDIREQRAGLDFKVEPFIACTPSVTSGGSQPSAGLSFKINF